MMLLLGALTIGLILAMLACFCLFVFFINKCPL